MNIKSYLERINFKDKPKPNKTTLFQIHQTHQFCIPFEDLNIHYDIPIVLTISELYKKIVREKRGGFCYELNTLFHWLLKELGFKTKIIAAKVIDKEGNIGPAFDHLALVVDLEEQWLVDVGFGADSFIQPLELKKDVHQKDVHDYFKIMLHQKEEWLLMRSEDGENFKEQYVFNLEEQAIANFEPQCQHKQISPTSHFVKNRICTKATPTGRISLLNDRMTIKKNGKKQVKMIESEEGFLKILEKEFGILGLVSNVSFG